MADYVKARRKRMPMSEIAFYTVLCAVMGFISFIMLYPFYYCMVQSLNDGYNSRIGGVYWYPRMFTLENYSMVFANNFIVTAFGVTVARTLTGIVVSVLFQAIFAYGLSKPVAFRRFYSIFSLITMYFTAGLIPFYILIKNLRLMDTFFVYFVPFLMYYFNIMLFIANYRAIPASIEEATLIDGANEFRTFFQIVLPLSTPILATITLFTGVWHWNDWFTTAIYTRSNSLYTLPAVLRDIINYANNQEQIRSRMRVEEAKVTIEALRYATMMVAVIPITVIYPFLQKYFVKGMMVGAIKA